jgi:tRNA wybutosine-synthesizing protein 2
MPPTAQPSPIEPGREGKRTQDFRKLLIEGLGIPEKRQAHLPRGFQRIGHIVILNLKPDVMDLAGDIAGIVLENYPYVRTVCLTQGVSGELREPSVMWLAGERGTETVHTENRCRFRLDVTRVMFSKGNLAERARLPAMVNPGETIVDMFAGIGYFSIPIARHARPGQVYAIEKNPAAFNYLKENTRLNRVQDRVTPILGDCREVRTGDLADRVIMGYLPGTYQYLPAAFGALKPGGGIIHYHDTFAESELWEKPLDILETQAFRAGYALKAVRHRAVVKEYAPGVCHAVVDVEFASRKPAEI